MALQSVSSKPQPTSREDLLAAATRLRTEIGKRIVGQQPVVEEILIALLAGGHVLLVGVPGLAKTLMIRSVSEAMDLDFKRIQFTPDLVPSDITGTEIMEEDTATGARSFRFVRGPVFANILLADEKNVTTREQRDEYFFNYRLLPDDPLPDLGTQTRRGREQVLTGSRLRFR